MEFLLNGRPVAVSVAPETSLLDVLRESCGLHSMKDGCAPEGSCGACTVLVDGHAVVSCARPVARVDGRSVETLEGLGDAARDAWTEAFVATGAFQCGFCTPGLVMKAEALLRREAAPTREEIATALAGNLCRCTGYLRVIDAIERAAAGRRGEAGAAVPARDPLAIGDPAPRCEARDVILGARPFVADLRVPSMLHGALRLADHPRAIVRRIDTTGAASYPGVVRVATWRDVPGERFHGLITPDWPLLVAEGETTRYTGDVLAAIAATTRAAAREAAALVEVEYEVLDPVLDPVAALDPSAPALHPAGNLLSTTRVRRGDVDEALGKAAHVVTKTFTTQRVEHAFLEPEAALAAAGSIPPFPGEAERSGPELVRVLSQGQGIWEDRRQIAAILGLPERDVRVTHMPTGGGFGGKEDLGVQGQAALLSWRTGRPVLVALSRAESLRIHPKRHPMTLTYTVGCDEDGRLLGVRARIVGDTGAYASVGAKVLERAAGHACGAYRVPAVDVEAHAVYTNNPPAGAMRGFGVPQATFAIEGCLDRLAELVGIDGWEIRWRNALAEGDRFTTGQRLGPGVGLRATLRAVRDAYRAARYAGIACAAKNTGIGNGMVERGRAVLRPEPDGTVTLWHSWTEMGQGIHSALRRIAAHELGIAPDRIRVVVDTERELDTGETTASRATVLGGRAVIDAAGRLRTALDGRPTTALAGQEFSGEFVVDWTTPPDADVPDPVTHLSYGWATQVVVLDDAGRIERVVAAQDVGRAIDRDIVAGQVEGGVHMGLGYALSESFESFDSDGDRPPVGRLKDLGIVPAAGMPPVDVILVEAPQPDGPYGAKGAGETVLVPTAAAVAGALHAFDGRWRTSLPMRDSAAARAAVPRLAHLPRGVDREHGPADATTNSDPAAQIGAVR